jgi:hypothetical protein
MRFQGPKIFIQTAIILCLMAATSKFVFAQTGTGSMRGTVTDPSGAAVADTSIIVTSADGQSLGATAGNLGAYEIRSGCQGFRTLRKGWRGNPGGASAHH